MSYPQIHCIRDTDHGQYRLELTVYINNNVSFKGDVVLIKNDYSGYETRTAIYRDLEFYCYADAKDWLMNLVLIEGTI